MMECTKNKEECECTCTTCPRHGKCCECISYHKNNGGLPACLN